MSTVSRVEINTDVYWVCEDHAFSTEREEIMGLLMGEINDDNVVEISAIKMLQRSDKRKDRVEISTEQLVEATEEADQLTKDLGRNMRVVGWYHSHPHITVFPSAVDCRTQASYQQMDGRFVGIIFSVFPGDGMKNETQHLKVICFQSADQPPEFVEVDVEIVPKTGIQEIFQKSFLDLPNILFKEETEQYKIQLDCPNLSELSKFQNESVYSSSIYNMLSVIEAPAIETLDQRNLIMEQLIGLVKGVEIDLKKKL